jgi:hypothetical protein
MEPDLIPWPYKKAGTIDLVKAFDNEMTCDNPRTAENGRNFLRAIERLCPIRSRQVAADALMTALCLAQLGVELTDMRAE